MKTTGYFGGVAKTTVILSMVFSGLSVVVGQDGSALANEESVNPGINDSFLASDLDVAQYVERFEREGREVYLHRDKILEACEIDEGMRVADVGAGTGLFAPLLAKATGPSGHLYAVDIVPAFLARIAKRMQEEGLGNVTPVLCTERSVSLPSQSVDKVFICDTYHHFEYPKSSLASIRRALRPGGELILIDFKRIPGESSEWMLNHVRAGQEVFTKEIEEAGFERIKEVGGFLKENYMIRFRKIPEEKS